MHPEKANRSPRPERTKKKPSATYRNRSRSRSEVASPHLIHRRTGKIARLPHEARELLNIMLRDGLPYALISKRLAEKGHKISENNLSRWHTSGGYSDWLNEQSCLDELRMKLDFANDLFQQKNGELLDAGSLRIAVLRLYTMLMTFDPSTLNSQIATQPGTYARILNVLCKLTETSLKFERHRQDNLQKASAPLGTAPLLSSLFQKPAANP